MQQFTTYIQDVADAMFMPWTVGILLATGLFFTIRTRFVQVRRFPEALRTMVATQQAAVGGALSPFQAFMTGLAATIGVGNIAGVATAIIKGGPGALFWIWCYGLIAAAVKFSEAGLGLKYRIARGENTLAGPMYYLRDAVPLNRFWRASLSLVACALVAYIAIPPLTAASWGAEVGVSPWLLKVGAGLVAWAVIAVLVKLLSPPAADARGSGPKLAWLYAMIAGVACLLTTPFTQPNSIAVVLDSQLKKYGADLGRWQPGAEIAEGTQAAGAATEPGFSIELNRLAVGVLLAMLTWLVIIGGVKTIGRVAEKLSPLKVGFYLIGGIIVIALHITKLPEVLALVFREAFSMKAGLGTAEGAAIWVALRYGLARGAYANEAGYGTAAVVYGVAKSNRPDQQGLNAVMEVLIITFVTCTISALTILLTGTWKIAGVESADAVSRAFDAAMPHAGGWMVAFSVFLFGYTTLMGWSFYGEQFLEYLFGPRIIKPYRWIYCLLIPLGAIAKVDLVWAWGDILNGSQIFPNLIGLFALSGVAAAYARKSPSLEGRGEGRD